MFGFLFALRRQMPFAAEKMQPQVVQLFIVWFFICFFLPNVGNAAHGAGGLIGWALGWSILRPKPQPIVFVAGISALVLVLMFVPSLSA